MNPDDPLWIDVEKHLPWIPTEPYLLDVDNLPATLRALTELGFRVVRANTPDHRDLEDALLVELTSQLGFNALGADSWAAFNDRLWDLQHEPGEPPVAIVIEGFDRVLHRSLHTFTRCIHNLVSMTESVGLADPRNDRQIEYFFAGTWTAPDTQKPTDEDLLDGLRTRPRMYLPDDRFNTLVAFIEGYDIRADGKLLTASTTGSKTASSATSPTSTGPRSSPPPSSAAPCRTTGEPPSPKTSTQEPAPSSSPN